MCYIQKTSPDPDPFKFGPDPGLKGLQGTSDTKYEIKKGFKNYLLYLFNRLLKISPMFEVKSPGSFGQNRVLIPDKF